MKRLLLAATMAVVALSPALAADLPQPYTPPPRAPARYIPPPPVYDWSGIYIGINGGYGFGRSSWTAGGVSSGNFNLSGGLVGATLGANFQMDHFVAGIEGDWDWSDIKGSTTVPAGGLGACTTPGCTTDNTWLATIRARAGFAVDRALIFATAGGAFGGVKATDKGGASATASKAGWTAGGGVEFGITRNVTAKVEYLYANLGSSTCTACVGSPSVKFSTSLVRAGLNFKFNPY